MLSQNESFINTYSWLKELKRIIKIEGSIWIHSTYHNSGFVNVCCQLLGLEIINEIAWYKRNSFPNLSGRRLTASHETILWVHKGGEKNRKYYFNYEASKSFHSSSDLLKQAGKQMRTVWDISNNKSKDEMKYGSHPTQKPIKVSERILALCGVKDGNLLVPFAGYRTEDEFQYFTSVTSITDTTFYSCTSLSSITIPNSVTTIGEYKFSTCTSLSSITIPDSVTTIGNSAFRDCSGLTSVIIGSSVKQLGYQVFSGCMSITTFKFNGPMDQWRGVFKGYDWHYGFPSNTVVTCTDGTVPLD